jgi:hypothetical protein
VEPAVTPPRSRALCTAFAGLGFLVLIVGITYFAMLVLSVRYGAPEPRAAAYVELGQFLSGQLEWYRNARVYGSLALVSALVSLLFGVSPLARITIPVAGGCYVVLFVFGDKVGALIESWARTR